MTQKQGKEIQSLFITPRVPPARSRRAQGHSLQLPRTRAAAATPHHWFLAKTSSCDDTGCNSTVELGK